MKSMRHFPILSLANLEFFWRNVFGHQSSKPRRMPKGVLTAIAKRDGGGGIEDHVIFIARVAGSRPYFSVVLPLKPRPTGGKEPSQIYPSVELGGLHKPLDDKQCPNLLCIWPWW
jgi:hypothetical protein